MTRHRKLDALAAVDQALASLRPLAVGLLAVRMLPLGEFGAFSIMFVTFNLLRGSLAAAIGNILLTRAGQLEEVTVASAQSVVVITALVASVCFAACGLLLSSPVGESFLFAGLLLAPLLLFDFHRTLAHSESRSSDAAIASTAWFTTTVLALLAYATQPETSVAGVTLLWAAGSVVGAAWLLARRPTGLSSVELWRSTHGTLSRRFALDFALMSGAGQAGTYALGLFGGLRGAGALRVAQLSMSPTNSWIQVCRLLSLPRLGALRAQPEARQSTVLDVTRLVLVPITLYVLLVLAAGGSAGSRVFGTSWEEARVIALPIGIAAVARAASATSLMTIQALTEGAELFRPRIADAGLTLGLIVGGAWSFGLQGAAWGHALANSAAAVIWLLAARPALKPAT